MRDSSRMRMGLFVVSLLFSGSIWATSEHATDVGANKIVLLVLLSLLAVGLSVWVNFLEISLPLNLPFLVGLAHVAHPYEVISVSWVSGALGSFVVYFFVRPRPSLSSILVNLGVQWLGVSLGILAAAISQSFAQNPFVTASLFGIFCLVPYVLLLIYKRDISSGKRLWASAWQRVKFFFWEGCILLGCSVIVIFFIQQKEMKGIPFVMIPLIALNGRITTKSRLESLEQDRVHAFEWMLHHTHSTTITHHKRVAEWAKSLALKLGYPITHAEKIFKAALFHDIGKVALDETVLNKPSKLNFRDMFHIQQHPEFAASILSHVPEYSEVIPWILAHHERVDGRGYPNSLVRTEIPEESKILAVVDAFDAMIDVQGSGIGRTYRKAKTVPEALDELKRCSGTQFDPKAVDTFIQLMSPGSAKP